MRTTPSDAPAVAAGTYTVYPTFAYFSQLRKDIAATKPGDRVLLISMNFEPSQPSFRQLFDALRDAATRGVEVTLGVDAHDFLIHNDRRPGPLFFRKGLPPARGRGVFGRKMQALDELRQAGALVRVINKPRRRFTSPVAGRSHIKVSIVNNTAYLGGCNLRDETNIDLMASWQDSATADWLYQQMHSIVMAESVQAALGHADIRRRLDTQTELLIDVGVHRQSLIYQTALEIISQARDWIVLTCQFFPNSTTALALRRAHQRGVRVCPIFNHYSYHTPPHNLLQHSVTARERLRMPDSFFAGELPRAANPLHAKLIVTDQDTLLGSHNYVPAGVNFGTAEAALHSRSRSFAHAGLHALLAQTPQGFGDQYRSLVDSEP